VAVDGDYLRTPHMAFTNDASNLSVKDINSGMVPWLSMKTYSGKKYASDVGMYSIYAGTTYGAFLDVCKKMNVGVYEKTNEQDIP